LTAPSIDWGPAPPARLETFQAGTGFLIGDIEVQSFTTPHDAVDSVGYAFTAEGVRIGVATDMGAHGGEVPENVKYHLRRTDLLLLEANYDTETLRDGPYPWIVKQRIAGQRGHLSNDAMKNFVMNHMDANTSDLVLGHISENNNSRFQVENAATEALSARGLSMRLSNGLGHGLHVVEQRQQPQVYYPVSRAGEPLTNSWTLATVG
jgi:phosphoribosyl 1,2-cyclic phosphodiesterase